MIKFLLRASCAMLLAATVATPAVAQETGTNDNTAYGGASGEFLLLGAGARGTALGGAYAALATDVTAMYYNAAGLAQLARPAFMLSTSAYLADTRYSWVGLAFPSAGGARAIGVSMGSFGFSDQPIYTVEDPEGNGRTYSVRETFISGTYAQNFSDRFSAGFTLKFINDRLGTAKASGVAVDFGTNFHASVGARPIRASFVIQNLGTNLQHSGEDLTVGVTREPPLGTVDVPQEPQSAVLSTTGWTLPVLFRVGVALDLVAQGNNRLTVLSEFTQPNNTKPGAGAGFEYSMLNIGQRGFSLAARGSYTIQPDNQTNDLVLGMPTKEAGGTFTSDGLALGGGLEYNKGNTRLGFDYAWKSLGTLGSSNFLTFTVGW
ncbi:MAG TPA: PorV/PorQ family protein [Gemmatimonadales bacterium]|nr:PorV/PorQ family protein [Gemmatimonadales bacterium]